MTRPSRFWFPGASYHITARGVRKLPLFHNDQDYRVYMRQLLKARNKFPFSLHSFCLMSNHIHLQLETKSDHIRWIMHSIQSNYAIYYNHRYRHSGHVFEDRYGSKLILTNDYFIKVSRYIHLNPVKAKLVEKPADYKWSSYSAYLSPMQNPFIETEKILAYFAEPAHKSYQQFVEGLAL